MRGIVVICSFIAIGILTAVYIAFGLNEKPAFEARDNEVEGLNEKYVIRFSHVVAKNTPKDQAATYFAQLVKEKTDGWVEVQVTPNGALYEAQEEFDALRKNEVQMIAPAFAEVTVHDPKWLVMDLPFLFEDDREVAQAFEGEMGRLLFESIDRQGYKALAFWDNGFKQITNNIKPIIYPKDLNGMKIRIMPSEVLKNTYKLFGAAPTVHPFNEVYSVLNDGTVDGTENTLSNIYSKGFHRKQKYMTISNHNYLGYVVLVNPQFWESLPMNYQASITEAMDEATRWLRENARTLNDDMLSKIESGNHLEVHYQTTEEKEVWREAMDPIYREYRPMIGEALMAEVEKIQAGH